MQDAVRSGKLLELGQEEASRMGREPGKRKHVEKAGKAPPARKWEERAVVLVLVLVLALVLVRMPVLSLLRLGLPRGLRPPSLLQGEQGRGAPPLLQPGLARHGSVSVMRMLTATWITMPSRRGSGRLRPDRSWRTGPK